MDDGAEDNGSDADNNSQGVAGYPPSVPCSRRSDATHTSPHRRTHINETNHECLSMHDQSGKPMNRWLLLDSCSTVDIYSNGDLLDNIHKAESPIKVRCNAGSMTLTHQGFVGDYPMPVWYNPDGVTNIMSLNNVRKYYRISMDTDQSPSMFLHKSDGNTIEFTPSSKGVYRHELRQGECASKIWCFVTTVADRASLYTKRQYLDAKRARLLQNIMMRPGSRQLSDTAIHHLKNCPVTEEDIRRADDIFGPNLGSLKGKTVRRAPPNTQSGAAPVPQEVASRHKSVELAIDIMFINKVAFFITRSRVICYGTVEAIPNRQVNTIVNRLHTIVNLYRQRGFVVSAIHADPEFEAIRPSFPQHHRRRRSRRRH